MENYGTMDKTMVLWTKLWYYTDNQGTLIDEGKKTWYITKNQETLIYNGKHYENNKIIEDFNQIYSFKTLIFYA